MEDLHHCFKAMGTERRVRGSLLLLLFLQLFQPKGLSISKWHIWGLPALDPWIYMMLTARSRRAQTVGFILLRELKTILCRRVVPARSALPFLDTKLSPEFLKGSEKNCICQIYFSYHLCNKLCFSKWLQHLPDPSHFSKVNLALLPSKAVIYAPHSPWIWVGACACSDQ